MTPIATASELKPSDLLIQGLFVLADGSCRLRIYTNVQNGAEDEWADRLREIDCSYSNLPFVVAALARGKASFAGAFTADVATSQRNPL